MGENHFIFRSLASGSSGNCYYLGTSEQGILIDAGISARTIQRCLKEMNLDFSRIMGVLITHDHADHIRAVGTLGEKVNVPIYATKDIHAGIDRNYGVSVKLRTSRRYFEPCEPFELAGMKINTFHISHDSTDCLGYRIEFKGERFALMTDCGTPNPDMEDAIRWANHLVIEANHDEQMLLNGPYPVFLKQRILSDRGHQSNVTCGELLADNFHSGLRHVFLCHLSHENNDAEVATRTVREYLESVGCDLTSTIGPDGVEADKTYLRALDRLNPSPVYVLNHPY